MLGLVIEKKHMVERFESDSLGIWTLLQPIMEADEVKIKLSEFSKRMVALMEMLHEYERIDDESYDKVKEEEMWIYTVKDYMYSAIVDTAIEKHFGNFKTWKLAILVKKVICCEVSPESVIRAISFFETDIVSNIERALIV